MTAIRYTGNRAGYVPFFGKATKQLYRFGKSSPFCEVDDKDVDGFLNIREGGKSVFAVQDVEVVEVPKPEESEEDTPQAKNGDSGNPDTTIQDSGNGLSESTDDVIETFDFSVVNGIGSVYNNALYNAGIRTVKAFLSTSDEILEQATGKTGKTLESWRAKLEPYADSE